MNMKNLTLTLVLLLSSPLYSQVDSSETFKESPTVILSNLLLEYDIVLETSVRMSTLEELTVINNFIISSTDYKVFEIEGFRFVLFFNESKENVLIQKEMHSDMQYRLIAKK